MSAVENGEMSTMSHMPPLGDVIGYAQNISGIFLLFVCDFIVLSLLFAREYICCKRM